MNRVVGNKSNKTTWGKTPGGKTPGGKTTRGKTLGGKTLGGKTPWGKTPGGKTPGGKTTGGKTTGGKTLGGKTLGGKTLEGKTLGGKTPWGKTLGGKTPHRTKRSAVDSEPATRLKQASKESRKISPKRAERQDRRRDKRRAQSLFTNKISDNNSRVLIVGRPNTGKSTLFNRLLRIERSPMTASAGMTQDWIESELILPRTEASICLIDTAGAELDSSEPTPSSKNSNDKNSNDKAQEYNKKNDLLAWHKTRQLIEEVALILFVLDARTALTSTELDLAKLLRGRRVIVVVNKAEGLEHVPEPCLRLGFADLILVSALQGRGIDDLLGKLDDFAETELILAQHSIPLTTSAEPPSTPTPTPTSTHPSTPHPSSTTHSSSSAPAPTPTHPSSSTHPSASAPHHSSTPHPSSSVPHPSAPNPSAPHHPFSSAPHPSAPTLTNPSTPHHPSSSTHSSASAPTHPSSSAPNPSAPFAGEAGEEFVESSEKSGATSARVDSCFSLALLGMANSGKSTLANRLIGGDRFLVSETAGTTRNAVDAIWREGDEYAILVDTAGLRRKSRVTSRGDLIEQASSRDSLRFLRVSSVMALVIDCGDLFYAPLSSDSDFLGVAKQSLIVAHRVLSRGKPLILLMNKWDLLTITQRSEVLRNITSPNILPDFQGLPIITLSALYDNDFSVIFKTAKKLHFLTTRREKTAKVNAWLDEAQKIHRPPIYRNRQITLRYASQVEAAPPRFVIHANAPVANDYIRYLKSSLRKFFDWPAVPIVIKVQKKIDEKKSRNEKKPKKILAKNTHKKIQSKKSLKK